MQFGQLRTLNANHDWNESVDTLWIETADSLEPAKHDTAVLDTLFRKYIGNHDL